MQHILKDNLNRFKKIVTSYISLNKSSPDKLLSILYSLNINDVDDINLYISLQKLKRDIDCILLLCDEIESSSQSISQFTSIPLTEINASHKLKINITGSANILQSMIITELDKLTNAVTKYVESNIDDNISNQFLIPILVKIGLKNKPQILEQLKDIHINNIKTIDRKISPLPLQRYGLNILKQNLSMSDVKKLLNYSSSSANWNEGLPKNTSVILMTYIYPVVISYTTRSFIDTKVLEYPCISKELIEKTRSIIQIEHKSPKIEKNDKPIMNTSVFGTGDKYIYIRNVAGCKLYDILSTKDSIMDDNICLKKIIRGPSLRITSYHKNTMDSITKRIIKPNVQSQQLKKFGSIIISQQIKDIFNTCVLELDTFIAKHDKIKLSMLETEVIDIIIKVTRKKLNSLYNKFAPTCEMKISVFCDLHNVLKSIKRTMYESIPYTQYRDAIKTNNKSKIISILHEKLNNALKLTLDGSRSIIYQLVFKDSIMNSYNK